MTLAIRYNQSVVEILKMLVTLNKRSYFRGEWRFKLNKNVTPVTEVINNKNLSPAKIN